MKLPYVKRAKRGHWTIGNVRVLGVTHRVDSPHGLLGALRMIWRVALSPLAIRRRRYDRAFYRSGWRRAAFEEIHGERP